MQNPTHRNTMKTTICNLLTILFLFGCGVLTHASTASDQTATVWGKSVQGVQLSIMIATNDFQVGSSTTLYSVSKNSSTNVIIVQTFAPSIGVSLISSTGKVYPATKRMSIRGPRQFLKLNPGEETAESIPVTFGDTGYGETVEPGRYTLIATRHFSLSKDDYIHEGEGAFEVKSNPVKVQITKVAALPTSGQIEEAKKRMHLLKSGMTVEQVFSTLGLPENCLGESSGPMSSYRETADLPGGHTLNLIAHVTSETPSPTGVIRTWAVISVSLDGISWPSQNESK